MIYLGADHRGYELKELVKSWLLEQGYEVEDVGAYLFDPDDDYFDFGVRVAESIEGNSGKSRGILLCGTGHGMSLVANRFPRVRAILAYSDEAAQLGRQDEDANVLILPANYLNEEEARERVQIFLETEFSGEMRHRRRLSKVEGMQISNRG